jgi:hypothetical protein
LNQLVASQQTVVRKKCPVLVPLETLTVARKFVEAKKPALRDE